MKQDTGLIFETTVKNAGCNLNYCQFMDITVKGSEF